MAVTHATMIEVWASDKQRKPHAGYLNHSGLRWVCSCGRIGPFVSMRTGEAAARRKAERGGVGHVSRMTRT